MATNTPKPLALYYPAKPYSISQGWGIKNPSYLQFGFSRHNGEDFLPGKDKKVYSPINAECVETGYTDSKGNFARFITNEKYLVLGVECYIGFVFLHFEKIQCLKGQMMKIGDLIGIAGNTGFSTGPHTHGTYYRLSERKNLPKYRLDTDKETDYTLNPLPYWQKYHAVDYPQVVLLIQAIQLLKQFRGV